MWGTLDVLSGGAVAFGLRRVSRTFEEKTVPLMGILAAFVFAAQMINIPVGGGTSGHFLGGVLIGALLGPWAGLIVTTVVLIVQCFLFQDGGVAALGANIFNMGIVGTMGGALLFRVFFRTFKNRACFFAGFAAAWCAVFISSLCCAGELALSGTIGWKIGFAVIGGVHFLIGLGEGIVTGTVLETLSRTRPDLLPFRHRGE